METFNANFCKGKFLLSSDGHKEWKQVIATSVWVEFVLAWISDTVKLTALNFPILGRSHPVFLVGGTVFIPGAFSWLVSSLHFTAVKSSSGFSFQNPITRHGIYIQYTIMWPHRRRFSCSRQQQRWTWKIVRFVK